MNAWTRNEFRDEQITLQYKEMAAVINTVHILFSKYRLSSSQCVFIKIQNDVGHTLLILFLLTRKINCFLGTEDAVAPLFCDWIISCKQNDKQSFGLSACWEVVKNNKHVKSHFITPGAGKVFFASSGTTGAPKFIMHQSGRLLQNAGAVAGRLGFRSREKVLIPVPLNHMYGFGVGFLPSIMTGARCHLIEKNNIIKLYTAIGSFKPSIVLLTPSVCKMMLLLKKDLPVKPLYISAGDKISKEVYSAFEERFGRLVNLYGCTELGAIAVSDEAPGHQQRCEGIIRPLKNVSMWVGETGEPGIHCKHEAGFEAYVNEYGQELFNMQESWFFTRDMGRNMGNNTFKITGRADHCTNRLGFLVSFREIEHTMENLFSSIKEVIVIKDNKENLLGDRLIACCLVASKEKQDVETIKKACYEKMPRHLVPDDIHFISELPRFANGKPDRLTLSKTIIQ
jgi:acyl-coenzyme A synthetase/AMP-(fatty) acid ligase